MPEMAVSPRKPQIGLRAAAPRRHHHGRQRALGRRTRAAARRGPPARRRGAAPHRRAAGDDLGIEILTLFSFSSENWSRPPAEIRDLMGLLRRFVRNDLAELHREQRAGPHHRRARRARPRHRPAAPGGRGPDSRQYRACSSSSPSTTAAARRSRAPPARLAEQVAHGTLAPSEHHRGPGRPASRRAGPAGSGPHHPHQRRAAALQLPDVAVGLQRARVRSDLLARFRSRHARDGDRRVLAARAPVRRTGGANRIMTP